MKKFILIDSEGYITPDYFCTVEDAIAEARTNFSLAAFDGSKWFKVIDISAEFFPRGVAEFTRFQYKHGLGYHNYE